MGELTDKILNIMVFAFIGLMIWLFFRNVPEENGSEEDTER